MNIAGVHSALGGVWTVFYLPAIWLLDKAGVPEIRFVTTLVAILFQEIVFLIIVVPLIALWIQLKAGKQKRSDISVR